MEKKVYIIDNLDCANCAAKIEAKMNAHPQVKDAAITFSTRQLRLTAEDPDALIPELQELARTVESDAVIYPRDKAPKQKHSHEHARQDGDCCGHEHHHQDEDCCGHEHYHHDEDS